MVKKRRRHSAAYKFRIALEALEGSKTISQLSSEHEIHPNLKRAWNRQPHKYGPRVFYSHERLHRSPDFRTPADEHFVLCGRQTARCRSEPAAFL